LSPFEPGAPSTPFIPGVPSVPATPSGPVGPVAPLAPGDPVGPVAPGAPFRPTGLCGRGAGRVNGDMGATRPAAASEDEPIPGKMGRSRCQLLDAACAILLRMTPRRLARGRIGRTSCFVSLSKEGKDDKLDFYGTYRGCVIRNWT
jgi:hypothetical protein